jgi:hypothetical protein
MFEIMQHPDGSINSTSIWTIMTKLLELEAELSSVKTQLQQCTTRQELNETLTAYFNVTELEDELKSDFVQQQQLTNTTDTLEAERLSADISLAASDSSLSSVVESSDTSLEALIEAAETRLETELSNQDEQIKALENRTDALGTIVNPAGSCQAVLEANAQAPNGDYYLDIGGEAVSVFCLMDKASGGWTHVYTTVRPIALVLYQHPVSHHV